MILGLAVLASLAPAGQSVDWRQERAVMDTLSRVPPKWRAEWLLNRGLDASRYTEYRKPESTGLRLVGKYGRGPSVAVTGKDTLVVLTLGSEVALLNCANPHYPQVLSEIQVNFLPGMSVLHDSFVFIGGNGGLEVWNIANPAQPAFRHVLPYAVSGFAVCDTFLYFVSQDTFSVYSIGRPVAPYRIGCFSASGNVGAATPSTVVMRQPGDLLGFVDVTDPTHPKLAGTYPGLALAFAARNNICCAAMYWSTDDDHFRFEVLDISDPTNVRRLGAIDSVGGWDIHLSGPFAFISGFQTHKWEFTIVDLQDSANPHVVSSCRTPSNNYGVWADWTSDWAYVADMTGLAVINTTNINLPVLDTVVLKADLAQDVWVDANRAYVADYFAGLRVLDVSDPSQPVELGGIDSLSYSSSEAVAVRDSFAFLGWMPPDVLRSVCVLDPTHPVMAGGVRGDTVPVPKALAVRDTLLLLAGRFRFQIVNVARPRSPVLVGSCVLSGTPTNLWLTDTIAFASKYVVNVTNPALPVSLGTLPTTSTAVAVRDTFLFAPELFDSMSVFSIASITSPRKLTSLVLSGGHFYNTGIELVDSLLYVGGNILHVVDVTDPVHPVEVGSWQPPREIRRLQYDAPYLYAACMEGGVCILESTLTGVTEPEVPKARIGAPRVWPSVTNGRFCVEVDGLHSEEARVELWSATGEWKGGDAIGTTTRLQGGGRAELDLTDLSAGVYVVRVRTNRGVFTQKVVKTNRR